MKGQLPPHCPTHARFPLPCAACAFDPHDVPRAPSTRLMRPAITTAGARERRLAAVSDAAERVGKRTK